MSTASVALAKLAGIRKAVLAVLSENVSRNRGRGDVLTRASFPVDLVGHYFTQASVHLNVLRAELPALYADFQYVPTIPETRMVQAPGDEEELWHYSRAQLERLIRDIDQLFELRANSELAQPQASSTEPLRRVFLSHGRSQVWRSVQAFVERDLDLATLELAQEPNLGRTIIEKLYENSLRCDSAVIVMTGDDIVDSEAARVRENVMHEIGFFQGRWGRRVVVLLHEDGVSIPTNLAGVVYIPFPQDHVEAGFHVLQRELKAIYSQMDHADA